MDKSSGERSQSNILYDNISLVNTESATQCLYNESIQETTSAERIVKLYNTNEEQGESSSQHIRERISSDTTRSPNTLYSLTLAIIQEDSLRRTAQILEDHNPNSKQFNVSSGPKISGSNLKTPDSLGGAPPSYSFVIRQASLPRPRLMGTFIPSPSFVLHTPPPNYATAFDIYFDNPLPNPARTYRFGYMPMYIICPECGFIGVTAVDNKIIMSTHLCALILCLLCCWVCAPLPYVLRSCKEVHHYCSNCRVYLGMYNPTHPEHTNART